MHTALYAMTLRCIYSHLLATAIASAAGASACTSTETSSTLLTSPSESKCQYEASGSPSAFPAAGGQGSLTIGTTRECAWTVAASTTWVSIGSRSGQGGAAVSYSVAQNAVPSPRSAVLSVEGIRVELRQDAAPCRYAIDPQDRRVDHAGGSITVSVETLSGCSWTAASSVSWLSVTAGASGNASGTVTLLAAANTGSERVGRATIAGQTLTVVQSAQPAPAPGPPTPSPNPIPGPPPTPEPAPPPPPPPGTPIELKGTMGAASGACPYVTFTLASRVIVANGSTDYERGSCGDLQTGIKVEVRGRLRAGGSVDAERIKFEKGRDDDE